uniref:Calpain-5 n=1 Tax=Timema douglasi TaxID=61478 RepID=A0A7R8VK07_TIMDO|nr:unnamed protein product [Timema douglasi]
MVKDKNLFKDQNYEKLRKHHQKLESLFIDPYFPPSSSSIGNYEKIPTGIEWKRPADLCESPRLFNTRGVPKTITRGQLSSAWMVSACSILAGVHELCHKVVPDFRDQEWDQEKKSKYAGIFHFRFWWFGDWVDVVVDDLLPTVDNQLLFTQSCCDDEFWTSLVEKAYAKLHGSYESLEGGHLCDALVDFTGGVSETVDLRAEDYSGNEEKRSHLFDSLHTEMNNHSLLCATVMVSSEEEVGTRSQEGLIRGYTYPVTAVKRVQVGETSLRHLFNKEKLSMVRLIDARGEERKPFRPSSAVDERNTSVSNSTLNRVLSTNPDWTKMNDAQRERIGLTFDEEGEFWMPLEDFVSLFTELTLCRLLNINMFSLSQSWSEAVVRGAWSTGVHGSSEDRSGGCSSAFTGTFLRNPQFLLDVGVDGDELLIQLLQGSSDGEQNSVAMQSLLIGFSIIKVEENRKYRLHKLWDHTPVLVVCDPIRRRQIYYRGPIAQGRYILVPTAHKPGDEGPFLLRIFSSRDTKLRNIKRDMPKPPIFWCLWSAPLWITVVHIKSAEELKSERFRSLNPYCTIKCEGEKARTPVDHNTKDPHWDSAFVFYRKKTDKPIEIKVFNHKALLWDQFLGQVQLPATLNHQPTLLRVQLMDKSTTSGHGGLLLQVLTDDNLSAV